MQSLVLLLACGHDMVCRDTSGVNVIKLSRAVSYDFS
jgi:hypothetical protein